MLFPDPHLRRRSRAHRRRAERQLDAAIRGGARTLELRLDYLRNAAERAALLRRLPRVQPARHDDRHLPHAAAAANSAASPAAELAILAQAVRAGCRWCDVEMETAERYQPAELRRALAPARLLVSAHDFRARSARPARAGARLDRCGAHAVKIAAACRSLGRSPAPAFLARGAAAIVVVPMGEDALARAHPGVARRQRSGLCRGCAVHRARPAFARLD